MQTHSYQLMMILKQDHHLQEHRCHMTLTGILTLQWHGSFWVQRGLLAGIWAWEEKQGQYEKGEAECEDEGFRVWQMPQLSSEKRQLPFLSSCVSTVPSYLYSHPFVYLPLSLGSSIRFLEGPCKTEVQSLIQIHRRLFFI